MKDFFAFSFLRSQNQSIFVFVIFAMMVVLTCSCSNQTQIKSQLTKADNFQMSMDEICNLPSNTPLRLFRFRSLGGGSWGKWTDKDFNAKSDYGCLGQKDVDWLYKNTETGQEISVEYTPMGNEHGVSYISVEYFAPKYLSIANERTERGEFCDFVNFLVEKTLKTSISQVVKEKILNARNDQNDYFVEKTGNGYIHISSRSKNGVMDIDIEIYASRESYHKSK